ncbi:la protein 1 [Musa acuminata AAA Group]|uniref:la protein 1 n=1 Tax=Musa acuminata AAA Group TaxID=214697 RepID=UPI0031D8B407
MAATPLDEAKAKNVLRQVEFYFSDSNLPRDNFLKKTVQDSEDGLVSLALLCSFTRMKNHLGLSAAMKPEEIPEETVLSVADVLRSSPSLRVSEDGKRVGRSTEMMKPEEVIEQVDSRTIAVTPLPYDVKSEVVESFFALHGKVNSVRLPRHVSDKRHFCGTALIEFSEEADATKLLEEKLVFAGAELEIKPKKDFDSKRERMWKDAEKSRFNRNASNGSYPKGVIVAFKLKKKQEDKCVEQNGADKVNDDAGFCKAEQGLNTASEESEQLAVAVGESTDGVDKENETKAAEDVPKEREEEVTDDVAEDRENKDDKGPSTDSVEVKNPVPDNESDNDSIVTREDLKQIFQKFGAVKYVDYRMGEESGYIRFDDPDAATKSRAMAVLVDDGGLTVKNYIVTLEALTGESEKEYWNLLRSNQERHRGRGGKYNRGGRTHGKRPWHTDSAERQPRKSHKVEATA